MKVNVQYSVEINGVNLSKEDIGLVLELLGFEVDYTLSTEEFFLLALKSLSSVDEWEVDTILGIFAGFTSADKTIWREIMVYRSLAEYPFSNN